MNPKPRVPGASAAQGELLARRLERLSSRAKTQDEGTTGATWVATFPVGVELFALPVASLAAAVPLRLVTPVPLAPASLVGVFRHEGEILPVFSLASLLGVRGWRTDPAVVLVLQLKGDRRVGVDCEQVPVPVALETDRVNEARAAEPGPVALVRRPSADPIQLVDPERLLEGRAR